MYSNSLSGFKRCQNIPWRYTKSNLKWGMYVFSFPRHLTSDIVNAHQNIFLVQRVFIVFILFFNIADINVHLRCRTHNLVSFSKPAPLRHYLNYNISIKTIRFEYTLGGVSHLTTTFCAPHANGWGPHPAASWLLDLNWWWSLNADPELVTPLINLLRFNLPQFIINVVLSGK